MDLTAGKIIAGIIVALQAIIGYFFKRTLDSYDERIKLLQVENEILKTQLKTHAQQIALSSQKDSMDVKLIEKDIELVKQDVSGLRESLRNEISGIKDMINRVLDKLDENDRTVKELIKKSR